MVSVMLASTAAEVVNLVADTGVGPMEVKFNGFILVSSEVAVNIVALLVGVSVAGAVGVVAAAVRLIVAVPVGMGDVVVDVDAVMLGAAVMVAVVRIVVTVSLSTG